MPPSIIFGDIRDISLPDLEPILHQYNITRLDSAAVYAGGESERRLGEAHFGDRFKIDTKIATSRDLNGTLTPEKIDQSSKASLERLQIDKINVLYFHGPDFETPVAEQARGFDDVYKRGRFRELGLCNCPVSVAEEWTRVAKEKGYIKPTWFQGHYNLFVRAFEKDLFPLLRSEGIKIAAYSPYGGGFLLGNLTPKSKAGNRFTTHSASSQYLRFFDRPSMHTAFETLQKISETTGISTGDLSLRWLFHHSQLQDDDVVIFGGSKPSHLTEAVETVARGPLDATVVQQLESLYTAELHETAESIVDIRQW